MVDTDKEYEHLEISNIPTSVKKIQIVDLRYKNFIKKIPFGCVVESIN